MHTIHGTSSEASTFTLRVKIGECYTTALVDSGSTTTFMIPEVALLSGCKISNHLPIQVAIANGGLLASEAICHDCSYNIQGKVYISDFRLLCLKGYNIILGSD